MIPRGATLDTASMRVSAMGGSSTCVFLLFLNYGLWLGFGLCSCDRLQCKLRKPTTNGDYMYTEEAMRLLVDGDGNGFAVRLHVRWRTLHAMIRAILALIGAVGVLMAQPLVKQLGHWFGWW
jgi:hypothetical protein